MTSVPDLDLNIKSILNGIRKAKEYKADIVLFPENCAFMGRGAETLAAAAEESEHPTLLAAKEAALSTIWNSDGAAPKIQTGTIIYKFSLSK